VLGEVARHISLGRRVEQVALPGQIGEQIGHATADHTGVTENALAEIGDGRAQRFTGLALRVQLRFRHGLVPPKRPTPGM